MLRSDGSDQIDQSAGSGTGNGKDKVTANWGAWSAGAWWEAPGGGNKGGGEGKGGEESRGGGQGKGGKWRKPGTVGFLKNHRKMLTHMAERGAIQLELAELEYQQACRDFEQAKTQENTTQLCKAADWVRNRSQNVDRIAHKWRLLDEEHLYMFTDHGEVVPLTEREKQFNITIRQKLATASVANAPPPPSSPAPPPKATSPVSLWQQVPHAMPDPSLHPPQRVGQSQSHSCTDMATSPSCHATSAKGKAAARQDACRPRSPRRSAVDAREKREAQQGAIGQEGSERNASRPRPSNWNDV